MEGDDLEQALRTELGLSWGAHKSAEDADYIARRDAHRASWTGKGFRPDPRLADDIDREWEQWLGGDAA